MIKNVLIGIGGTGSKIVEAAVHLCAAGLGPDKLNIFLIDPDHGNGNLTRTKTLIKEYTELRKRYQRVAGNTSFKTEIIIPPGDEPFVWNIFGERDYTLAKYINYDNLSISRPEIADLANILFTRDELNEKLNRGFRGHPSIGAVVMADPPMEEYPFKLLWDGRESMGRNDLRVFIAGSIFGGTGAAGFPTLGSRQLIKFNESMQASLGGEDSRVLLGGALVLPYFTFSADSNKVKDESMFVTPADFPVATKAALQYYNDKELGFDQYYFIGDSLAQKVGEFSTGSAGQQNDPHYVELVSALASFDFFGQAGEVSDTRKYFIACRKSERFDWSAIPVTRNSSDLTERQRKLKHALADLTVFAYTYLTYGKKELGRPHREITHQPWYSDNFKRDYKEDNPLYNPAHSEGSDLFKYMDSYLKSFLFWICAMDDKSVVSLVDSSKILAGGGKSIEAGKLQLIDPELNISNIGKIIAGKSKDMNFNAFRGGDGLQQAIIRDGTISAGSKYLNIFYEAAARFNRKNLVND